MENDLISIIVPVYNVQEYLRNCVESISAQTYSNLEIILVDDGSTDTSGEICDEYAAKDSRIRVIHKKNGGLSDARNCGIDATSGSYIGFVDSDDWIEPDMYEQLHAAIKGQKVSIAVCGLTREYRNRSIQESVISRKYNRDSAVEALLEGDVLHDHAVTKLYKRDLFNEIRFPVGRYYEDVLTTYRLFLASESVVSLASNLYHYRQRGGSIIKGNFNSRRFELINALHALSADIRLNQWEKNLKNRLAKAQYTILFDLAVYGDKAQFELYNAEIDSYLNNIKQHRKELQTSKLSTTLRLITKLYFLPNPLLFFLLKQKRSHYLKLINY